MNRGDIVWVDLGNPPGGSGREESGDRPGVVISNGDSDPNNPMFTIVPLTCSRSASRFPFTVDNIIPSNVNGLTCTSVAMVFQIRSLDKRRVRRVSGRLEIHFLSQIEDKIKNLLFF